MSNLNFCFARLVIVGLFICFASSGLGCVSFHADGVGQAEDATTSEAAPPPLDVPWSVSRHVWPSSQVSSQTDPLLAKDLDLIAEVGARFVRTDVWWYAIEPKRGEINEAALVSYSRMLNDAKERGLEVLVILSGPPDWAKALYKEGYKEGGSDRTAFFDAFRSYAAAVAKMVGTRARYYQLWNEPNHVSDFVDGEGDLRLFERGKTGIAEGLKAAGASSHHTTTILNVLVDGHDAFIGPSWMTDVEFYMEGGAGASIDVIGIDHYPGTWSVGDWGGNILDRLGDLGRRYHKSIAVLETGLSTPSCSMPWNSEGAQANWINEQLPRIHAKARALQKSGVVIELLNWFKLEDRDTTDCLDPEDRFGVVRTDRTKKPGFAALRGQIATFSK